MKHSTVLLQWFYPITHSFHATTTDSLSLSWVYLNISFLSLTSSTPKFCLERQLHHLFDVPLYFLPSTFPLSSEFCPPTHYSFPSTLLNPSSSFSFRRLLDFLGHRSCWRCNNMETWMFQSTTNWSNCIQHLYHGVHSWIISSRFLCLQPIPL